MFILKENDLSEALPKSTSISKEAIGDCLYSQGDLSGKSYKLLLVDREDLNRISNEDAILSKNKQEEVTMEKTEKEKKEKPLEKYTAKELREMALGLPGVHGVHAMKKEELIAAIRKAKGLPDEEKKEKKVAVKKEKVSSVSPS
jgi:hypothetical protein